MRRKKAFHGRRPTISNTVHTRSRLWRIPHTSSGLMLRHSSILPPKRAFSRSCKAGTRVLPPTNTTSVTSEIASDASLSTVVTVLMHLKEARQTAQVCQVPDYVTHIELYLHRRRDNVSLFMVKTKSDKKSTNLMTHHTCYAGTTTLHKCTLLDGCVQSGFQNAEKQTGTEGARSGAISLLENKYRWSRVLRDRNQTVDPCPIACHNSCCGSNI